MRMRRRRLGWLLMLIALGVMACKYTPVRDPVEPTMLALTNLTGQSVYLDLADGNDPLGAAVTLQKKGEAAPFAPRQSCAQPLCSDGCDLSPCALAPAVRVLLPDETLSFTWSGFRFDAGTQACLGDPERACLVPSGAPDGRYLMRACFGRSLKASGGAPARDPRDPSIIVNAAADDIACSGTLDIGVPSNDVRYQIYLR